MLTRWAKTTECGKEKWEDREGGTEGCCKEGGETDRKTEEGRERE